MNALFVVSPPYTFRRNRVPKITDVQLVALRALDENGAEYNPAHRPRGSLERLKKKGFVAGGRKVGWALTDTGRAYLRWKV